MKVFISWSGQRSKLVGELISSWLKCVIQASEPWISSKDIDRGAIWFSEINDQLKNTAIGIICLTSSNINKPWILFESGALAKGLSSNKVCTFLIDIKHQDIQPPLSQFNHTLPDKEGLWLLIRTINSSLNEQQLDNAVLETVFETYWPQFEEKLNEILQATNSEEVTIERDESDILSEVLNMTRTLDKRLRKMEMENQIQNYNINSINKRRIRFSDDNKNDMIDINEDRFSHSKSAEHSNNQIEFIDYDSLSENEKRLLWNKNNK